MNWKWSASHAATDPLADKEWRDGWDAIKAPWGLIVRQVPLIAVHAARKSLPARHAALTQRRPPVSRPGSSEAGPPRKIAQRRNALWSDLSGSPNPHQ